MPKIPKDTRWRRFVTFIKGVLFYNTIYWGRASDGLQPPRPSREERREKRPMRDLSIIKPREKPRARLDQEPDEPVPQATILPKEYVLPTPAVAVPAGPVEVASQQPPVPGERRKRRVRRKHHKNVGPVSGLGSAHTGVLKRIFGWRN